MIQFESLEYLVEARMGKKEQEAFSREMDYAIKHHHSPGEGRVEYLNSEAGNSAASRPIPQNPKLHVDNPEEFKQQWDNYHANHHSDPYTQENYDLDKKIYLKVAKDWGLPFAERMHRHAEETDPSKPKRNNLKESIRGASQPGWMDRHRASRILGSTPTDDVLTPATDRLGFFKPVADAAINKFKSVKAPKPPKLKVPKAVKTVSSPESKPIKPKVAPGVVK